MNSMADMKSLKQKAKDALHSISDVSKEAYKIAEEKTIEIAKKPRSRQKFRVKNLKSDNSKTSWANSIMNSVKTIP
jgi:SAM-dependent MidA family methyltransferase